MIRRGSANKTLISRCHWATHCPQVPFFFHTKTGWLGDWLINTEILCRKCGTYGPVSIFPLFLYSPFGPSGIWGQRSGAHEYLRGYLVIFNPLHHRNTHGSSQYYNFIEDTTVIWLAAVLNHFQTCLIFPVRCLRVQSPAVFRSKCRCPHHLEGRLSC